MRHVVRDEAVTKEEFEERVRHIPTKEEYYKREDEMMTELKAIREEQTVHSHQVSNHEDRLQVVESKLKISPV